MDISAMYNFKADPDLEIGNIAIRRISCACDGCLDQLNFVWKGRTVDEEQPKYKKVLSTNQKTFSNVLMSEE